MAEVTQVPYTEGMSTSKDRPNHPELYGLSFEELILQAKSHLARALQADPGLTFGALCGLSNCLEELLWRQRRSIDDEDIQAEIEKVKAERGGILPWKTQPIDLVEEMLTWWRQSGREAPPGELAESHLHAMIHTIWKEVKAPVKVRRDRITAEEVDAARADGTFDEKFELGPEEDLLDHDYWMTGNLETHRGRCIRRKHANG